MANEGNGQNQSRLDRMEGLMQLLIDDHLKFSDEHNKLLTAQVVLTDRVDKLTVTVQELAESQKRTDEKLLAMQKLTGEKLLALQEHTDERLSAFIGVIDGMIRGKRPEE
jgi:hypothetical protein